MKLKSTASVVAASLVLSIGGAAAANAVDKDPGLSQRAMVTAQRTARMDQARRAAATMFKEDGLDANVVNKYNRYVKASRNGTYRLAVPESLKSSDPAGARAAERAVVRSNRAVEQQLRLAGLSAADYRYGDPIAMGSHATFTPLWWGMKITFDQDTSRRFVEAFDSPETRAGADPAQIIIQILQQVGAMLGPEVKVVFDILIQLIQAFSGLFKGCANQNGMEINSLWLPTPWCEAPKAEFNPGMQLR